MAKVFPFFGFPPFRFLIDHVVQQEGFLPDAETVLHIEDERFEKLVRALVEFDGFLDRGTLSGIVSQILPPDGHPDTVSGVVWRLNRYVRESDETLTESLQLLKTAIEEHSEGLETEQRSKLGERLARLIAEPPGFSSQHKAEKLVEATGRELTALQVVCDVRPVFNEERTEILGALPVSTLTLDFFEADGRKSRFEVRLSERQIGDLCAKADSARSKVVLIKKLLKENEIVLPMTPATVDNGDGR